MSPSRQRIYLIIFSLILITSFFAILKLLHQNHNYSQSEIISKSSSLETQSIDWEKIEPLVATCQIKSIFQRRDLTVTLRTKNNLIYHTTQPTIGEILKLAKKYQGPCDIIQTISE